MNKYFKFFTVFAIGLLVLTNNSIAQDFRDLENKKGDNVFDDGTFKLFWRYSYIDGKFTQSYGGWTIDGQLALNGYKKGSTRVRYENPTIGDFILVLARQIKGGKLYAEDGSEQAFGGGWTGWFQFYKNLVATDNFLLSPGITHADYIFSSRRSENFVILEPTGYYFAGGLALMATYTPGMGLWADVYANYNLPYARVKGSMNNYVYQDDYPNPHFLHLGLDIHHVSRFYTGIRLVNLIDRGQTTDAIRGTTKDAAQRWDISVGYYF